MRHTGKSGLAPSQWLKPDHSWDLSCPPLDIIHDQTRPCVLACCAAGQPLEDMAPSEGKGKGRRRGKVVTSRFAGANGEGAVHGAGDGSGDDDDDDDEEAALLRDEAEGGVDSSNGGLAQKG